MLWAVFVPLSILKIGRQLFPVHYLPLLQIMYSIVFVTGSVSYFDVFERFSSFFAYLLDTKP